MTFYGIHKAQCILSDSSGLGSCMHPGASRLDISEVKRLAGVACDGRERRDRALCTQEENGTSLPQPSSPGHLRVIKGKSEVPRQDPM